MRKLSLAAVGSLLAVVALAAEDIGKTNEKLLCGFETEEMPADGLLWKGLKEKVSPEQTSQGKSSWLGKIKDQYGFLNTNGKEGFYRRWRSGGVFRTLGWFDKVFPADWSDWPLLRVDFRTDGPAVRPRMEIEDLFLSFPVVSEFDVPGNTWVTLEVDLEKAIAQRRLDPKRIAHLLLMIWSVPDGKREFACYMDNIRLAKRDAPATLPIVKGGGFLEPYAFGMNKRTELAPTDTSKTSPAEGKPYTAVETAKGGGGYPLIYVNERCVGGFGDGGLLLAPGPGVRISLDAGKTWTGLDGKDKVIPLTGDHRGQHRSQTMIEGPNIFMAYCTAECGGGGARVTAKFTKAVYKDGTWVTGPESIVDQTSRYCHDRFALCRDKGGRLWCAWSHLNNLHKKDIRAKWSQDDGDSWLQAGENARIGERGVFHYPGTPGNYEGPYLTKFDDTVAAFWHREPDGDLVWTRAVPLRTNVKEAADGKVVLPLGAKQGVKRDGNVFLEKDGKVSATLTVDNVEDDRSVAIELPGPAGVVKAGDEVTVMTWTIEEVLLKGSGNERSRTPRPQSAATDAAGVVYLGVTGPKVLRYDASGKTWLDDSPPELKGNPLLSVCGKKLACLWIGEGGVFLSVKPEGGKWGPAKKIVDEPEAIEDLAAPQNAPEKFIPAAWSAKSRKAIKTVAVPVE
ncbi:MAG: sialidase family protein [Planctomycetota bacterium]